MANRFYKAPTYNPVDYMYNLPAAQMMKAIAVTDAAVDNAVQQTDLFGNAVSKINHLTSDNERVLQIQDTYNKRIQDTAKALQADPTNYRKQMPLIRSLGREISTDMATGEIAAIQANAAKLNQWDTMYAPLVAKGEITPDAYRKMKTAFVKNYQGANFDAKTGNYNQLYTEDVYKTQDFNKLLKDKVGDIKANSKETKNTGNGGQWLVTNNDKDEWVDARRVAQIATDALLGDENVKGYLRQGGKYGYLQGVNDENGNFIPPYQLDKAGQPVFDMRSPLSGAIRAMVGTEAFRKSSTEHDIAVNPYAMEAVNFSHDLQKIAINNQNDRDNFNYEEGIKQANAKELATLKASLAEKKLDKVAETKAKLDAKANAPKVGNASNPVTSPLKDTEGFEFTWTPKGTDGKISNEGLLNDIAAERSTALKNRNLANDERLSTDERSMYMSQAIASEKASAQKAALAYQARQSVNGKLIADGFDSDDLKQLPNINKKVRDLKAQISALDLNKNIAISSGGTGGRGPSYNPANDAQIKPLVNKLKYLEKIANADSKHMESWFKDNQDKTSFKVKGAGVDVKQQKLVMDEIKKNPELYKPLDLLGGKTPKVNWGEALGDVEISTINPPMSGIPASITVKQKTTGELYVVPITGNLQKTLATQLANSKNPEKSRVGRLIKDSAISQAIAEVDDRIINFEAQGGQPQGYTQLPEVTLNNGARFAPQLIITPSKNLANTASGNLGVYNAKITTPNGGTVVVPNSANTKDATGNFASVEDAVRNAFKTFEVQP